MTIQPLDCPLTVCKLSSVREIDLQRQPCFLGVTGEEISLVCPTDAVPGETLAREDGWRGFRIEGTLDFSLVGVLAELSGLLARSGISLFAVSTYDTDYILVKEDHFERALAVLAEAGHTVL